LIERSFQGLSGAIETVRIFKELMEIWLNEVCDNNKELVKGSRRTGGPDENLVYYMI